MELNWTTFLIEIVNFLVLVWILTYLLYKPVMRTIEDRRREVEDTLSRAESLRDEASAARTRYEERLKAWHAEQQTLRESLKDELAEERKRLLATLNKSLEEERQRAEILEERRKKELARRLEEEATVQATRFLAQLLQRFASPEIEARLVDLTLDELPRMPPERRESLLELFAQKPVPARITTAYTLPEAQRLALREALVVQTKQELECEFSEDPALLAGLRIGIGPLVFKANLQDELRFFADSAHGIT